MKNEIVAFIVGIEKYDQPDWDVAGPCANALAVAGWCLSVDVPPEHIFLFLDAKEPGGEELRAKIVSLKSKGVKLKPCAQLATIDTFFRDQLAEGRPPNTR